VKHLRSPSAVGLWLALAGVVAIAWFKREGMPERSASEPIPPAGEHYVGAKVCADCHRSQYDAWRGSHHALAMQPASSETVLGDFHEAQFTQNGVTSRFFQRDGHFVVNTDGPDGKLADFEIRYAFGVTPLQQYLVELPGGRMQALPIAWDSRPQAQGGQRWFHLYPGERIDHHDPLHWTGLYQNWNTMCADCHSTEVRHNYERATDRFDTRWSEVSVACEACHGPGSAHIERARKGFVIKGRDSGLTVRFDQRQGDGRLAAMHETMSLSFEEGAELKACAVCHSRRTALTNAFSPAEGYDQHFLPAALRPELYHVDGQIQDEVYEYNSFRQSKMFAKGVTCSDCHDPHALKLRGDAETVCRQCHTPERYAGPAHHHHRAEISVRCVDCHMPQKTYMVVDPRRDHSFRVPRPDLSVRYGVPNACSQCHRDKSSQWASAAVRSWLGRDARGFQQFADAFHAVRETSENAEALLQDVLRDAGVPPLVKGSLLGEAGRFANIVPEAVDQSLKSAFVAERLGGLLAVEGLPVDTRWQLAGGLLLDSERNVRIEAARILVDPALGPERRARLEKPLDDLRTAASTYSTMPHWRLIIADSFAKLGDNTRAISEFEAAIKLQPSFARAYGNLADFYRAQGQEDRVKETLERGLRELPAEAALHYALGLCYVRAKNVPLGMREMAQAAKLAPDDPTFAYGYAVALYSQEDKQAALSFLQKRLTQHPDERDSLYLLVQLALDQTRPDLIRAHRAKLELLARSDPAAQQLADMLQEASATRGQGRSGHPWIH
jgi:tetratricopeptide (TPR) repeat protein